MSRLPQPREGNVYKINGNREITFSFWPTKDTKGRGRKPTQERVYSNDPWSVIKNNTNAIPSLSLRSDANYFVDQAKDYFDATTQNRLEAAKPVLLYYCALNLVKALLIARGGSTSLDVAKHGLQENNNRTLPPISHVLRAYPTSIRNGINIFYELYRYFGGTAFTPSLDIPIKDLMRQIIIGHRLFVDVERISERFVHIKKLEYVNSLHSDSLWLRIYFDKEDIRKTTNSRGNFLLQCGLSVRFREVVSGIENLICFEQVNPSPHTRWPTDALSPISNGIKNDIWTVMLTATPYTRHYVFLRQPTDVVLPQMLSMYALFYYFSSVTRYRPSQFQEFLISKHGGFINEFVNNQIIQFLYSMATEFAQRDVSKPSVI